MMNVKNFITCSNPLCNRELKPTLEYEKGEAMISNYHCEQCCYTFSIYSITKTKLAEIQGLTAKEIGEWRTMEEELEVMEQHEMEDK